MSTAARVALTPAVESTSFVQKKSLEAPKSQTSAAIACPRTLLVGRQGAWSDALLKSLQKSHAELAFVPPLSVTAELAREGGYAVLLLDSTVPVDQRRSLVSALVGTPTCVFYTFPVENGCWWLPALQFGKDCHGAPAFRRKEFQAEIERILGGEAEVQ